MANKVLYTWSVPSAMTTSWYQEADYALAVKGSQGYLYDDIQQAFAQGAVVNEHTAICVNQSRVEKRTCKGDK